MSILSMISFAIAALQRPPIILGQGEQRVLKTPEVERFGLSGAAAQVRLVDVPDSGSGKKTRVFIKGAQNGSAQLVLALKNGDEWSLPISVMDWAEPNLPKGMLRALSALEEVEVIAGVSRATLRGTVDTPAELGRIGHLRREFEDALVDETDLSPELRGALERRLLEAAREAHLQLEVQPDFFLSGRVPYAQRSSVERKFRAIHPGLAIELEDPKTQPTVHVRVFLLEIRKDRVLSLGLKLDPLLRQNPAQIESALTVAGRRGELKVLARPELVLHVPGEAQLFSGGEFPVHVRAQRLSRVDWKPFGLDLKLTAVKADRNRVHLELKTEMSQLAPELERDQVPGVKTSRVNTQIHAPFGEPILLCGMLQETEKKASSGLPWVSEVPIFGALFGAQARESETTEIAAILIPSRTLPRPTPWDEVGPPRGPVPPPRNWIAPGDLRSVLESPEYPWNAF